MDALTLRMAAPTATFTNQCPNLPYTRVLDILINVTTLDGSASPQRDIIKYLWNALGTIKMVAHVQNIKIIGNGCAREEIMPTLFKVRIRSVNICQGTRGNNYASILQFCQQEAWRNS